ncbi:MULTISPECIES: response regulator [Luteibacter]|uniref:response regulator n=1 Tax=Luteibacter TaxID=242605 RepID=UPI00055BD25A|nr:MULTISPECIES: response regulator [unclassified Luteibacter]
MVEYGTPPSFASPGRAILVADDDAPTRQFLDLALRSLGYQPTLADDGERAVSLGRTQSFAAMLLDCRMPGGGALTVLAALRGDASALSRGAVALATSAEVPAELRDRLLAAGFAGVIEKPCQITSLRHALAATLGIDEDLGVLDDELGHAASGDARTLLALRQLLREELTELDAALDALADRPTELIERMHRLRSACGFCGTARLGAQAKALQNHLLETRAVVPAAIDRFRIELRKALAALPPRPA